MGLLGDIFQGAADLISDPLNTLVGQGSILNQGYEAGARTGGLAYNEAMGKEDTKPLPVVPVMPTIDSEAVRKARRRALLMMQARGGRSSTILSGGGASTLGGN